MQEMATDYSQLFDPTSGLDITVDDEKLQFIYSNEIPNLSNTKMLVRYDSDITTP